MTHLAVCKSIRLVAAKNLIKYPIFNCQLLTQRVVSLSGVDSVGTVSASLLAYASIQALQPDLIINAGTAGGFKVLQLQL